MDPGMQLNTCELSDGYAPDDALREQAFKNRQIFGQQELNTFFNMFAIGHLAFFRTFAKDATARRSLEAFDNYSKKHSNTREAATHIVRICNSFTTSASEDPFRSENLWPALRKYEAACKTAFSENSVLRDQKLVDSMSQMFQVQVVLLVHNETGVDGIVSLHDKPAPVIYLEKIQEIYSNLCLDPDFYHLSIMDSQTIRSRFRKILKIESLQTPDPKPRQTSPQPEKPAQEKGGLRRSTTKMPTAGNTEIWANIPHGKEVEHDTMDQKLQFLVEKERNLRSLVEVQMSLLRSCIPSITSSSVPPSSEEFLQTIKSAEQLATYLDIDFQVLKELENIVKNPVSKIDHNWMHCERYSSTVVTLRCGHKLCTAHVRESKNRCPFGCT